MIQVVTCPRCHRTHRLDAEPEVVRQIRRARCAGCGHVFDVPPRGTPIARVALTPLRAPRQPASAPAAPPAPEPQPETAPAEPARAAPPAAASSPPPTRTIEADAPPDEQAEPDSLPPWPWHEYAAASLSTLVVCKSDGTAALEWLLTRGSGGR